MQFAGINYLAVLIAGVAAFGFGAAWYSLLAKRWVAASDKTEAELKAKFTPLVPILTVIAELVMAFMLAGVLSHLGAVTARNGVITGFFVWLGFVMTTLLVNHLYQGEKRMLTVIDGGHWLGVLLLQGLVIGWMGV